jgi:hypothetical protein
LPRPSRRKAWQAISSAGEAARLFQHRLGTVERLLRRAVEQARGIGQRGIGNGRLGRKRGQAGSVHGADYRRLGRGREPALLAAGGKRRAIWRKMPTGRAASVRGGVQEGRGCAKISRLRRFVWPKFAALRCGGAMYVRPRKPAGRLLDRLPSCVSINLERSY